MSGLTENEDYLTGEVARLQAEIARLRGHLTTARETVEMTDELLYKAAKIAGHLPYLVQALPEGSVEIEQAALQLQTLLVQRKL